MKKYTIEVPYVENTISDYQKICNMFCYAYFDGKSPEDELKNFIATIEKEAYHAWHVDWIAYNEKMRKGWENDGSLLIN